MLNGFESKPTKHLMFCAGVFSLVAERKLNRSVQTRLRVFFYNDIGLFCFKRSSFHNELRGSSKTVCYDVSHCLFNIPLAVWILEGFISAVPKELDETAYVDGYSFWRFFFRIFIPTITAGIGITMFFCFMFSWVELLLAKTLTAVAAKPIAATMTRTVSTSGYELGLLAAAGSLTIAPGAIVIYFVRNYIAKGFALGRV